MAAGPLTTRWIRMADCQGVSELCNLTKTVLRGCWFQLPGLHYTQFTYHQEILKICSGSSISNLRVCTALLVSMPTWTSSPAGWGPPPHPLCTDTFLHWHPDFPQGPTAPCPMPLPFAIPQTPWSTNSLRAAVARTTSQQLGLSQLWSNRPRDFFFFWGGRIRKKKIKICGW